MFACLPFTVARGARKAIKGAGPRPVKQAEERKHFVWVQAATAETDDLSPAAEPGLAGTQRFRSIADLANQISAVDMEAVARAIAAYRSDSEDGNAGKHFAWTPRDPISDQKMMDCGGKNYPIYTPRIMQIKTASTLDALPDLDDDSDSDLSDDDDWSDTMALPEMENAWDDERTVSTGGVSSIADTASDVAELLDADSSSENHRTFGATVVPSLKGHGPFDAADV